MVTGERGLRDNRNVFKGRLDMVGEIGLPALFLLVASAIAAITDVWRFKVYNVLTVPLLLSVPGSSPALLAGGRVLLWLQAFCLGVALVLGTIQME